MSLINEALKRAKEAQNAPEPKSSPGKDLPKVSDATMRPVESRPQQSSSGILVLSGALVLVLVGAVVLLWMWSKSQGENVTQTSNPVEKAQVIVLAPAPPQAVPPPVATPEPPAVTVPEVALVPEPPVATPSSTVPGTATTPPIETPQIASVEPISAPTPAPEPKAPEVPQFPSLKLQGIFYNAVKPAAVINGKTYYIGGGVATARITKIETDKVTVEWNGETRELETAQ